MISKSTKRIRDLFFVNPFNVQKFLWLILVFIYIEAATAQVNKHQVTGRVTAETDKQPLPGANIIIKGTSVGTVSDSDGNYSIEANESDVIIFSYIGYNPEEITVGTKTVINPTLMEDITKLSEVVVSIGYGVTQRKDVTGSISSISGDQIRKSNPVTFDQALQGKVAGVVVQQVSGQPGGGVSIQIRGVSSFGNAQPLYVIDGVILGGVANAGPGTNPLAGINPSEIESVDVLKDASATAIYGSQATNGVIIITTKRGKVAAPQVSYEVYTGIQRIPKRVNTMNLREYATFLNERNAALGWGFDTREQLANPQYLGEGTDWQKELFRSAPMTNHTLTVSGGDNRTQYLLSGSYLKQEGMALGSKFNRMSVRLNLDNKTTDWLKIGTSLQLAKIKDNVAASRMNVIATALSQTPDIPVKNTDGSWGGAYNPDGWVHQTVNPYAMALINKDMVNRNQLFGNLYAEITFLKKFTLRNEATGSFSSATEDRFNPTYKFGLVENATNTGQYDYNQNINTTLRNYLTYANTFNDRYNTNVMVGHEAQLNTGEGASAFRSNFPSNNVQAIDSGDPLTARNSGFKNHSALESYFGRLNFGLFDKYLLTTNVRADGSSRFAAGHRWVTTYSAALAWKIQNEEFFKNFKDINELKLRVGYGLTNNQWIDETAYTSTLTTVATGLSGVSQMTDKLGNPGVEWEKTKYANIGLDAAFFNWRLSFSVDFYNKETDGMLMQIPLPAYSGTGAGWAPGKIQAPWVNVGMVNNKGFDFRISSTNIQTNAFTWKTDLTVSRNINEVVSLNTDKATLAGSPYSRTAVGRSIGEFYGFQIDGGVFATKEDLETHPRPIKDGLPLPIGATNGSIWYGDLKFKDLNGDGFIDEADQTYLGSPMPKFQIGFNNSFTYKKFDLNIFLTANYGNKVFNQLRMNGDYPGTSFGYFKSLNNYAKLELIDPNGSATDIDNVFVSNPETKIPGLRNDNTNANNRASDTYVEDGSFIRCKTIALGYTLSDNMLKKAHISSLRVYFNVSNAFLITKYKGMDPEIGSWNPLSAGYDNGFYPQPRVFTIGANLQLSK
jgi:TonB-dependent starch-binding outer membrane protein SusC